MKIKKKSKEGFRHMNQSDRDRMEALLNEGHLQKEIAVILSFDPSVICRERKRKRKNGVYKASTAQHKAQVKRSNSKYQGMKIRKYPELEARVIEELTNKRSPDEIAGRMKQEGLLPRIGTNAIYKWLYSEYGNQYTRLLCTQRFKKKKQTKKTKREMIPNRVPLSQRPVDGEHAEGDLFVSPTKSGTVRSGMLISVPTARLLIGSMIENRKPSTMVTAVNERLLTVSVNDTTWDNGIENKFHAEFSLPAYFCDAYSPWQKPHVEGSILLLRRWFIPKKKNLDEVTDEMYQEYLDMLNRKYRKVLGYKSAYEVALERGIIQKIPPRVRGVKKCEEIAIH
jgi:IS30 family transposase